MSEWASPSTTWRTLTWERPPGRPFRPVVKLQSPTQYWASRDSGHRLRLSWQRCSSLQAVGLLQGRANGPSSTGQVGARTGGHVEFSPSRCQWIPRPVFSHRAAGQPRPAGADAVVQIIGNVDGVRRPAASSSALKLLWVRVMGGGRHAKTCRHSWRENGRPQQALHGAPLVADSRRSSSFCSSSTAC